MAVAFPNGSYDRLTLEIAREVGFKVVFTTEQRTNNISDNDEDFRCMGRFLTTEKYIKTYGSFYRLGYTPVSFYSAN